MAKEKERKKSKFRSVVYTSRCVTFPFPTFKALRKCYSYFLLQNQGNSGYLVFLEKRVKAEEENI